MKKIKYSEITPEKIYNNRRSFIKSIGFSASSIAITSLPFVNNALGKEQDQLTSYKDITTYNNYYEFGTSKGDPFKNAQSFKTKPWNISIEGEVENSINISMEEISNTFRSEEDPSVTSCLIFPNILRALSLLIDLFTSKAL